MIVRITFKTPDAVEEAITEAVGDNKPIDLDDEEWEIVKEKRVRNLLTRATSTWFQWGEYVTVEWDTDKNTCTVVKP